MLRTIETVKVSTWQSSNLCRDSMSQVEERASANRASRLAVVSGSTRPHPRDLEKTGCGRRSSC
jgi:hypothetical protein